MESLKDVLQVLAYGVAVFTAWFSVRQYLRNSARERTRWLFELYQRFYEQSALKSMRIRIDDHDTEFVVEEKNSELLGDLDNFLNFFEFVAFLRKQGEIKPEEINAMFAYPLSTLATDKNVLAYIRKYGYEELNALLKEMGYAT
jgi:hypothetical protein